MKISALRSPRPGTFVNVSHGRKESLPPIAMGSAPILLLILLVLAVVGVHLAGAQDGDESEPDRLAVVWTSGDPDVAHRMVLMYTHASQQRSWFDENLVIVWGPSARLLAADKDLQAKVHLMMDDGVRFQACVVCADMYGVSPVLRDMGIEVKPMGQPLTRLLQDDGWDVMTF